MSENKKKQEIGAVGSESSDSVRRRLRAFELRERGLTYREIGLQLAAIPICAENARRLVLAGEQIVMDRYLVKEDPQVKAQKASDSFREKYPDLATTPIDVLELSVRATNQLRNACIATIGELMMWSELELMATKCFGKKGMQEIKQELATVGLSLRAQRPPLTGPSVEPQQNRRTQQ